MSKRLYFGNIKEVIEPPNLIEIQLQSYFDFLQQDTPAAARKNIGLQGVLKEIFPIKSYDENIELDFVSYDIEQPKMSDYEAIRAGETYSAALQVTFKLKSDNESKEETVYMGELPMMTNRGTFVINGAERVVDQIAIGKVAVPANWNAYVQKLIAPNLKLISRGQISIAGNDVSVRGEVANEAAIQPIPTSAPPAMHTFLGPIFWM